MKPLLTVILVLWSSQVYAQHLSGKVIKVADGDTLTLVDVQHQQHKIRLSDIDAPESGQPYGNRAKQQLNKLVYGKEIVADCRGRDQYERWLCTVYVGQVDVNLSMVQSGHAWVSAICISNGD